MKFNYKLFMFIGLLAFVSACDDDPGSEMLLANVAVLEISEATTATGLDINKSYDRIPDGNRIRDSIRVNLVGPQKNTSIKVPFSIDSASTAVEGTHYVMITANSLTIPANSNFGFIYFEVIDDNILPGEIWKLKLSLTGDVANARISSQYGVVTRSMSTRCLFSSANFVGTYTTNEQGYGTYDNVITADTINANAIIIKNFWDFAGSVKYVFDPTSDKVTVPTQDVVMGGVTYVVSAGAQGTYDACSYSFVVPYLINRKSDGALFDENTYTFTKK